MESFNLKLHFVIVRYMNISFYTKQNDKTGIQERFRIRKNAMANRDKWFL